MSASTASRRPWAGWDFYEPTNRVGSTTIPTALAVAALAGAAAFVYQRITMWMPLIYVNFLIAGGFAAGIGWVMAEAFLKTHGRAAKMGAGFAAGAAVVAFAVSFQAAAVFTRPDIRGESEALKARLALEGEYELDEDAFEQFVSSFGIGDYIKMRQENGWTVGRPRGGLDLSGVMVWLVWLAELGILAGGAYFMAEKRLDRVYCEECRRFCDVVDVATIRHVPPRDARDAIRNGTIDDLLALPSTDRRAPPLNVQAHVCAKSCPAWLDISTVGPPSKKGESSSDVPLLTHAGVASATLRRIEERARVKADPPDTSQAPRRSKRPRPPDV
ncbi:MAG: hypothetical protein H6806_01735 [Planctomycetes bacterium]|nr:hypothetical protein [Planctomycetota bacterium]MCB9824240.1 hypothetical protein [Planctomycetota bacterium]MCB9828471.1 hypothetical protein [Planctomycetota bacterium]MCB9900238.1 hypothetical protein [Planctomycetota bacterium]